MKYIIHTDGGARGNPGPAAVGVVIEISNNQYPITNKEEKKIIEISKRIGETTNNVAEYTAVVEALKEVKSSFGNTQDKQKSLLRRSGYEGRVGGQAKVKSEEGERPEVQFFLDSTLVVNQLNGLFKIKDARLRQLATQVHILAAEVGGVVEYTVVRREQNKHADMLVNKALDGEA